MSLQIKLPNQFFKLWSKFSLTKNDEVYIALLPDYGNSSYQRLKILLLCQATDSQQSW